MYQDEASKCEHYTVARKVFCDSFGLCLAVGVMCFDDTCEFGGWHHYLHTALGVVMRLLDVKQRFVSLYQFLV